ncbi:unnamed protein product [Parascedosporium putredinis]|uniref:NADH:flavin oxidoreductase/NADH oxidase N-terminal domain-containing protein n=1 Tax=Parascedosporium putredinis TaxID=1442378 RepID=A0A9P1H2H2_9PEZI|nr:unnamed protein product [Parascedosporium putredinis]CAI7994041.1 unnamed protein product [Parascedosporium putredinis]
MDAHLKKRIHPHHCVPVSRSETPAGEKAKKCASTIFNVPAKGRQARAQAFHPLTIRGVTMQNRIWVSPMCQYSAHEGFHNLWHTTHYGGMAQRGPGLVMLEATAVQANGRITPEDSGIWLDAHVDELRKHTQFAHSQNALIAIQLAHAGRKASTVAPWLSSAAVATHEAGGWPDNVYGPSDVPFGENYPTPRAMTLAEIDQLKEDFVLGARRAVAAGFDVVELHFAHGYLVFENRTRLALELVEAVRAALPEETPLFVRISATEWLDTNPDYQGESWTLDDTVRLAHLFAERGVKGGPGYQAPFAKAIKRAVGDKLLVSTVGSIKDGVLAEELISGGKDENDTPVDLVAAGRMFQKNPGLVWQWADDLGTSIQVAHQIGWGFGGRGGKTKTPVSNIP